MEDECLYHSTCYRSNLQYFPWLRSNPCLLFPLISCFMLRCIISRSRPSDSGSGCSLHAGSGSGRNQQSLPEETLTSSGQVGYRSSAEQHQVWSILQSSVVSSLQVLQLCLHLLMEAYVDLCLSFGLPVWIASLLCAAQRLRSDHARRKKVYRLMQRRLMRHGVGVKEGNHCPPTYVYPEEVKMLLRSAFPDDVCGYADPDHDHVVFITMEDLQSIGNH
ncbi:uncharacterized protein LOC119780082 [Cyprinodon tularosa]|uniref:uncharacterized protein LOC119780082 n=1 Tax=Cyprinodon tularosa TaxID=77115 RepID=UPI0018E1FB90|nr:uncharacterized protein LOC119780082 [Cyprinodon tularosa]